MNHINSKKKVILIADCNSGINENGYPSGHYLEFFKDFGTVLSKKYMVYYGCSSEYMPYLPGPFFILDPSTKVKHLHSLIGKLRFRMFEYRKLKKVLRSDFRIIILQSGYFPIQCLALMFSRVGTRKVFLTIYEDFISNNTLKGKLYKVLYKLTKRKIAGMLTSIKELAEVYGLRSLVVPDFFNQKISFNNENLIYDFAVLGIMNDQKDIETVIQAFNNTKYKVVIAGRFDSEKRFNKIMRLKTDNIEVINRYLPREEYEKLLRHTKYIILPYHHSKLKSSGIFYEALYNLKPVVVPSGFKFFEIVSEESLGYVYNESPKEILQFIDNNNYNYLQYRIRKFLEKSTAELGRQIIDFFED